MKLVVGAAVLAGVAAAVLAMQAQDATDWQTRAGGRMAFEVATVKPAKGAFVPSNLPLTSWDDGDDGIATNGRFSADATLSTYIQFAYKLWPNELQSREFSHLPKWVATDRYRIEARAAAGHPTKDQIRLMVQSLLAGRCQLAAHFEARDVAVFELRLAKAGQPGPKLIPHAGGPPCDKPGISPGDGLPGFPGGCHSLMAIDKPGTMLILLGARDVTTDVLAGGLSTLMSSGLGLPVIDKTGLTGRFDFALEWAREPRGPAVSDAPAPTAPTGPTPIEALRDQLGLKLERAKASLPILVIDRVERPTEN